MSFKKYGMMGIVLGVLSSASSLYGMDTDPNMSEHGTSHQYETPAFMRPGFGSSEEMTKAGDDEMLYTQTLLKVADATISPNGEINYEAISREIDKLAGEGNIKAMHTLALNTRDPKTGLTTEESWGWVNKIAELADGGNLAAQRAARHIFWGTASYMDQSKALHYARLAAAQGGSEDWDFLENVFSYMPYVPKKSS